MEITKAKYIQFRGQNSCIEAEVDGETLQIPFDPDNVHYTEILKQVEKGTLTIEEAD